MISDEETSQSSTSSNTFSDASLEEGPFNPDELIWFCPVGIRALNEDGTFGVRGNLIAEVYYHPPDGVPEIMVKFAEDYCVPLTIREGASIYEHWDLLTQIDVGGVYKFKAVLFDRVWANTVRGDLVFDQWSSFERMDMDFWDVNDFNANLDTDVPGFSPLGSVVDVNCY
ncbi:hypothetical protein PSEUBRA_003064 [Kalmanozyma brasiliensis GHG001]|uniref:uncharacterized protein n=1 Tax=Kalmanozyma brasiliensis (strain GHG001) TaxID=1365824 RepID=UPI002867C2AB|nr:uncharacterized protein PSEUBRA_003064 [Kalmanozyma brasiliensis GHG001]KAF6767175.1 hypothetical protein PSEUBRA_003064 [Kalmanozyma brasiliensis GHG001]